MFQITIAIDVININSIFIKTLYVVSGWAPKEEKTYFDFFFESFSV